MNREPCWDDARLAEVAELPDDHPELAHARVCTACRARLMAFRRFAASGPPPAGARAAEARARIHSALMSEIGAGGAKETIVPLPRGPAPGRALRMWPRFGIGVRLAAAAAVAIVAFGWIATARRGGGHSGEMRGSAEPTAMVAFDPVPLAGGLELRWQRVGEADRYQVVVLARDLTPAAGPFDTGDTTLVLRAGVDLANGANPDSLSWRVRALRGGRIVAESAARALGRR